MEEQVDEEAWHLDRKNASSYISKLGKPTWNSIHRSHGSLDLILSHSVEAYQLLGRTGRNPSFF